MERNFNSRNNFGVHPSALMIKVLVSAINASPDSVSATSAFASFAENASISELSQKPHSLSTYGRRSLKSLLPPFEEPCSICKDEILEPGFCLPCDHYFHPICVEQWFHSHSTCPICRKNIDYY